MNWVKQNILALIVILYFILNGLGVCNKGTFFGKSNDKIPDTVQTTNTVYVQSPPVTIPQYIPYQTGSQQPVFIPQQYKPDTSINGILRQYNEILLKFLAKNTYVDSVVLKDTSGKRVGVVNLQDEISENRFVKRNANYQLIFPTTTSTITITKFAPQRNQFYFGALLEGSTKNILSSAGLGALLKTKRDAIWTLNAKYQFNQQAISYEIGRYWKLSFRK